MNQKKYGKTRAIILLTCLFASLSPATGTAQRQQTSPRRGANRNNASPRLVLAIIVDQFRYDFLERFAGAFGEGGFRRLMREGAFFTDAKYDYVPTYTAPGHAAIFTGSIPAENGIVGNMYFDRETGKTRMIVSDDKAHAVTDHGPAERGGAPSPRALIGTTIGDQMRLATNLRSKVVTLSLKDRSAVFPGGQRPNGAYWFDASTGTMMSSDYYFKALPPWVGAFNKSHRPDKYFGAKWNLALKPEAYEEAGAASRSDAKASSDEKFPYTINGGADKPGPKFYGAFQFTPFASEYLADFAKAAVEAESLGADQYPDLLSVSFSTPDLVGHTKGPDSLEVMDTYIQLDRVIADLLTYIDRRAGQGNTIVFLTGDHGVSPVPERAESLGFDAGRISPEQLIDAVNKALAARFGGEKWVQAFVNDQLYLDPEMMEKRKVDPAEAERIAGQAALKVPGIVNYFTRTELVEGRVPRTPIARRVMNGFNRERSGDVWIVTRPFMFFVEGDIATTHGSPYNYDTHVPVIISGPGMRAGRYYGECSPSDIAPTIAALLGIEPPSNRVGRVLNEAMGPERPAPGRR